MNGFTSPNTTQIPNDLFEKHMQNMGEAELKVTLAVMRKTLGWHKDKDAISWSQIHEMTGLSRSSIQDGIAKAVEHGYIEVAGKGKRGVNIFRLVVNSDWSTSTTSTGSPTLPVNPPTGSPTLPTKETNTKETKQKKEAPTRSHPLFEMQFPSNVNAYSEKHIKGYFAKYTNDLVALIHAWHGEMYDSFANISDVDSKSYIKVHREMVRLNKPVEDYPALAKYTRNKETWKLKDNGTIRVADMLKHVTDYKPAPAKVYDDPAMDLNIPQATTPILLQRKEEVKS